MPLKCRKCKDSGIVTEYVKTLEFNPASSDQVKDLFRALGVKIPKKRGEDRETTEGKYLKRLSSKYPVFGSCLDVRKRNKLISDYMWKLDADNQVSGHYGFHPSTWRKSMRDYNLMVIPNRGPLAKPVRDTIVAPPGYVLVEADSEGIEAVLTAYCTGDPTFLKIAQAGPHGYFMSHVIGEGISAELPFDELKHQCKLMKKRDPDLYDRCKRTIHGTHYGLTPYGMHDEFEEQFPTLKTAKDMQQSYLNLIGVLGTWMDTTRHQAHDQRFLDNHFGYRHYFYNVFTWNKKYTRWELGEDGKRCIAFVPQSDASAIQTEYVLAISELADALQERYILLRRWLRLLIHDSLVFCVPESEIGWVPQAIADIMNMPFSQLGGLRIGVEVKVGLSMGEQSTVEINQVVH